MKKSTPVLLSLIFLVCMLFPSSVHAAFIKFTNNTDYTLMFGGRSVPPRSPTETFFVNSLPPPFNQGVYANDLKDSEGNSVHGQILWTVNGDWTIDSGGGQVAKGAIIVFEPNPFKRIRLVRLEVTRKISGGEQSETITINQKTVVPYTLDNVRGTQYAGQSETEQF